MLYLVHYIKEGKSHYKTFSAATRQELLETFSKEQICAVKIRLLPRSISRLLRFFKPKITVKQRIEIVNNLHLIVKSGVSLHEGLQTFTLESKNSSVESTLSNLTRNIERGMSLSQAMKKEYDTFGNVVIHMVKMGEDTGELTLTLQRAKEYLEHNFHMALKVKMALIYPLITLSIALFAVALWFVVVLPQLAQIYKETQIALPWLTRLLLSTSSFLNEWFLFLVTLFGLLVVLILFVYKKSPKMQHFFGRLLLRIPYIKDLIIGFNIAFIMQYLHLSLSSGVPLYDAVEKASQSSSNIYFKTLLERIKEHLSKGEQLSTALENEVFISAFIVRMIRVAEKNSALEEQFEAIAHFEYEKLDTSASNIVKVVEPILIVIIGLTFATIMLGMIEPIYDLVTHV